MTPTGRTKPQVARPLYSLIKELQENDYIVEVEDWDLNLGKGIDDLYAVGDKPAVLTGDEIMHILSEIEEIAPPTGEDKPRVMVQPGEQKRNNDEAIEALSRNPKIFQRGGRLVTVCASGIQTLDQYSLEEELDSSVRYCKLKDDTVVSIDPPGKCVKQILARPNYPNSIRHLDGVVTHPVLRPDGTILSQPGYDLTTRLYYEPNRDYPVIPEQPTKDELEAALKILKEPFQDFPFRDEHHRSAAIAGLPYAVGSTCNLHASAHSCGRKSIGSRKGTAHSGHNVLQSLKKVLDACRIQRTTTKCENELQVPQFRVRSVCYSTM